MVVGCVTTPIHGEALAHSRQASNLHVASTIGAGQEALIWHEPHGSGDYCIARRHPAACASPSEQNHRSPRVVSISVLA
jgi:hypothetical protein